MSLATADQQSCKHATKRSWHRNRVTAGVEQTASEAPIFTEAVNAADGSTVKAVRRAVSCSVL